MNQDSINNVGFENTAILYSISDSSNSGGKIGWIKKIIFQRCH